MNLLYSSQAKTLITFLLSSFLILLNQGVFWDDWTVYNMDFAGLKEQWINNGMVFPMYIYQFLNSMPAPVFCFHLTSLVLVYAGIVLTLKIFSRYRLLSEYHTGIIGILLACTPLYATKILLISIQYTFCYDLFLAAVLVFGQYIETKNIAWRILSFILFFVSFIISSLVVFYGLFLLLMIYIGRIRNIKDVISHIDLFILPVAFWIFKQKMLQPHGLHALENYNAVTASGLIASPKGIIESFKLSLFSSFELAIGTLTKELMLLVFALFVVYCFLFKKQEPSNDHEERNFLRWKISTPAWIVLCGVIVFIAGSFAYVVVGKIPNFTNFNSRNQLLLPLGMALIITGLVEWIAKPGARKYVYAIIVSAFVIVNVQTYLNYLKDSMRQQAIIQNIAATPGLMAFKTIIINDSTQKYVESETSQCVYTGMFKLVSGEETRLVTNALKAKDLISEFGSLAALAIDAKSLNIRNWQGNPVDCYMTLTNGSRDLTSISTTARLLVLQYTDPASFKSQVKEGVNLTYQPISQ